MKADAHRSFGHLGRWVFVAFAVVAVMVLMAIVVALFGARLEAPTGGLTVAAFALVFALGSMYRMAHALGRPNLDTTVVLQPSLSVASRRALREEKRRLLRAIKELDFDHAMAKVSDQDHRVVREAYQLQVVEVMRALEQEPALHPELRRRLDGSAPASAVEEGEGDAGAPTAGEARTCPSCAGSVSPRAKFCEHCGAGIDA